MNGMVERVAKALFAKEWANKGHSWEMEAAHHDYWRDAARAAITAMRDPTLPMLKAVPYKDEINRDDARMIWQAMIGAALQRREPE